MDLGPHAAFILAAYAAAFVVLVTLIGWVVLDYRVQRQILSDLDKSGVVRRSERRKRQAAASPAEPA